MTAILSGHVTKEAIKRVLCPLDPARYYEAPSIVKNLNLRSNTKILDISSPKLVVFYLAYKHPDIHFVATDIFEPELESWKKSFGLPKNLTIEVQDSTKLTYKANSFDEIFSLSVIEHVDIPRAKGDSLMMEEIKRVLKNNGKFVFSTMISSKKDSVYTKGQKYSTTLTKEESFFCRIYDYKTLNKNVLSSTSLKVIYEEVCNYRFPFLEKIYNSLVPISALFGLLNVLYAPLMINIINNPNQKNISGRAEYLGVLYKQ